MRKGNNYLPNLWAGQQRQVCVTPVRVLQRFKLLDRNSIKVGWKFKEPMKTRDGRDVKLTLTTAYL